MTSVPANETSNERPFRHFCPQYLTDLYSTQRDRCTDVRSTTDGTSGTPATVRTRPPQNLREAISAGSVLDVGKFVRAMSDEQAEVDLVAKDR